MFVDHSFLNILNYLIHMDTVELIQYWFQKIIYFSQTFFRLFVLIIIFLILIKFFLFKFVIFHYFYDI